MAQPAPRTHLRPAGQAQPVTAEPVPVAFIGRTSTLTLQDPRASLRRQLRSAQQWLPAGWFLAAIYWDIESGGLDLEQRSQGHAYTHFTDTDLPRDGGMADLLAEACSPTPKFAAVICEDIERSGRDMFNALKLEKELSRQGIPLFATDEPADIEGVNATTVLVRRVKQGVAEWYRLQLKEKIWKRLIEHSLDGWNIGTPPYGYLANRIPHPVPFKAAQGRTKTRLILDPDRAPVIDRIFTWRAIDKLGLPAIAARLNADTARYPAVTPATGWTAQNLAQILRNPNYTGHMVYGRRRNRNGRIIPRPPRPVALVTGPGPPGHHRPADLGRRPDGGRRSPVQPRRDRAERPPGHRPVLPLPGPGPVQGLPAADGREHLHRQPERLLPVPARLGQPQARRQPP